MQLNKLFLIMAIGIFFSWSASAATRNQQRTKHTLKKAGVTKNHVRKPVSVRSKSASKSNYSPGRFKAQRYFEANPRSIASASQASKYAPGKARGQKGKIAGNSKAKGKFRKSHQ